MSSVDNDTYRGETMKLDSYSTKLDDLLKKNPYMDESSSEDAERERTDGEFGL